MAGVYEHIRIEKEPLINVFVGTIFSPKMKEEIYVH